MVLCLSVKQWCNCVLLCFENVSMRVCQGRRKIILDTLEVEVSAFQVRMLSRAVLNQPGASSSTDLRSVLWRQLLGAWRGKSSTGPTSGRP